MGGVVGDDDGRDLDLIKIRQEIAVIRAEEHQPHRLALQTQLHRALDLVVVLVNEIDDQRMRR